MPDYRIICFQVISKIAPSKCYVSVALHNRFATIPIFHQFFC
uniref:Uncharacterized protein n=1 Tax=Arundo donax TaxID=35708 RepID=A0A0A9G128_ARUDO